MQDLVIIVGLTVGICLGVGLLSAALLHGLRERSLRYQLAIVACAPVAAVALTVVANVSLMFLSPHDSTVVVIALATAVPLAIFGSWLVLRQVSRSSAALGAGLKRLVTDSAEVSVTEPEPVPTAYPHELSVVLDELEVTRQTLAEARLRQRAAENARRELVTFLSHDLRTPLAGLRALAEGLEDGIVTDVPAAVSHLGVTVGRMSHLVDDLFELSRVQTVDVVRANGLVSLTEIIADVTSETSSLATSAAVELDTELPSDDRLAVAGSADDLARALGNLVSNAIRHSRPGETVVVSGSRADDGHIIIAVTDGCGGIPVEHLGRVFDVGWRGTISRSDTSGAGLGLAIARGVVESHDGRIAVDNVGRGCRFEVELPEPGAVTEHPLSGPRSDGRSAPVATSP